MQKTVTAYPETKEQLNALKAFAKAIKIKFEVTKVEKPYNQEFVDKILQGDKDIKEGKGIRMTSEEFDRLLKQ